METTQHLQVEGMKCQGCVSAVKEALEAVEGVTSVNVLLEEKLAHVGGAADPEALTAAVREAGFVATVTPA